MELDVKTPEQIKSPKSDIDMSDAKQSEGELVEYLSTEHDISDSEKNAISKAIELTLEMIESQANKEGLSTTLIAGPQADKKKQEELDVQLAAILQEQMYSQPNNPFPSGFGAPYTPMYFAHHSHDAVPPGKPGPKVKPPSLDELKKQAMEEKKEEDVCIVCKQPPIEYIYLPSCQVPHIYCISCAQKTIQPQPVNYRFARSKRKPVTKNAIKCVLCGSINPLDPAIGVSGLRRVKKRKYPDSFTPMICPEHKEEFIMFCTEFMQLMCPHCFMAEHHKKHTDDKHVAIDDASSRLKIDLQKHVESLKNKRQKLVNFTTQLTSQKEKIGKATESVREELKKKNL